MSKDLINKKNKENISKKILNIFKKKGFNFTDLNIVIDTDLLTQRSGEAFKKYALNFKDKSGKEISLRPDLTIATAIQYIQSKKKGTEKLSYFGSAFRLNEKGNLNVFDQIGCEIINSKSNPEYLVLSTILSAIKKLKIRTIILNDIGLFQSLINSLNLPTRWKLRLIRHYSRKKYFEELLKRLDTNYDLDEKQIQTDFGRLSDLKKLESNEFIAGRSVGEIIKRFEKKIKDPRNSFEGKKSVKIIKKFLKLRLPLNTMTKAIKKIMKENNLRIRSAKNFFSKLNILNKKIGKDYQILFDTRFGRETPYYTGIVFSILKNKKEVAKGGEYNNLIKTLGGKKIPAFGAAINLDQLL